MTHLFPISSIRFLYPPNSSGFLHREGVRVLNTKLEKEGIRYLHQYLAFDSRIRVGGKESVTVSCLPSGLLPTSLGSTNVIRLDVNLSPRYGRPRDGNSVEPTKEKTFCPLSFSLTKFPDAFLGCPVHGARVSLHKEKKERHFFEGKGGWVGTSGNRKSFVEMSKKVVSVEPKSYIIVLGYCYCFS